MYDKIHYKLKKKKQKKKILCAMIKIWCSQVLINKIK